jgi:hypothetical protein
LPFEIVFSTVRIIQVHEQPIFVYVPGLSNYSARCLELISVLMNHKKLGAPQVQDNKTAFANSVS